MRIPGVSSLAERVYGRIAAHRMLLGCSGDTRELQAASPSSLPGKRPDDTRPRWVRRAGYALLGIVAGAAFATGLPSYQTTYRPIEATSRILQFAGLDQRWDMFSPDPANSDGWLLGPARLADGTTLDLFSGGPPSSEPRYADPFYSRWVKVTERIVDVKYTDYRIEYARMFCRLQNWHLSPGQSPLAAFDLYYVQRIVQPEGRGDPVLVKHHIWSHVC